MSDLKKKQDALSPKVAAMYQAVYDLLLEDVDLGKVKVSDITSKAGIGKGTAYEYFETKEDIIAGAICEYLINFSRIIEERMYEKDTFMEAIEYLFNIFEEFDGSKEQNVFMKIFLLCIATIHSDFSVKLHHEFLKRKSCDGSFPCPEQLRWECLTILVEKGIQNGEIRDDIPSEYIVFSIISKVVTYLMYFMHRNSDTLKDCPVLEMKKLLLEEIKKNYVNP